MKRKDCAPKTQHGELPMPAFRSRRIGIIVLVAIPAWGVRPASGGSIHLWPSAVVTRDEVRLGDIADLRGFDALDESRVRQLVVDQAPQVCGSKYIRLEFVRAALQELGINLAGVTLHGSLECGVTRPAAAIPRSADTSPAPGSDGSTTLDVSGGGTRASIPVGRSTSKSATAVKTLRQAVVNHCSRALAKYGGRAEVAFEGSGHQILDLSGPDYSFAVRTRDPWSNAAPLGPVSLDVEVIQDNNILQTVSMVVKVTMLRTVAVARKAINQNAIIRQAEVELRELSFARWDATGFESAAEVIGQRAKRFIPVDTVFVPDLLETVPLVARGQAVTLRTQIGGVSLVSSGKALGQGHWGDVVKIRVGERGETEFEGVVRGPGLVEVGAKALDPSTRLARSENEP